MTWNYADPLHVFQHRVFGKYWNHVDFPWWFSVDIYVDFIWQKIPDEVNK